MVIPAKSSLGFHAELNTMEFQVFCISVANEIDAAIGKNEVPGNVQELALVLSNVCQRICNDFETKAVIMALMISAKSACQLGWFPERETQELLALTDLMWNGFKSPENVTPTVNSPVSLISQVIERFYPCVKLGHVIDSFEAKPESKILVKDFHINKMMPHSPKQRVGLFVFRTEDISKSNCIVHPQKVSFLLNGKGVDKRVNISMELGPQLPTNVTALLNAGANLLQAIGCFGGSYLIAIAFMDFIPLPHKPLLKDYVHPEVNESNSDCDIIEGPSRISLCCPISRTRIKLPVKGHVCKHLQCFDFWNYVNMNARRPSWRCPHCNQSVCYTDIRVDQKLKKILEEVGRNSADVVISADGSWTVVTENDEDMEHVPETTHDHEDLDNFINLGPTVLELDRDENDMESSGGTQVYEQNPCLSEIQVPSDNTLKPATDTMLNQSSAPINTLPQLPQTLNAYDRQQLAARQALPMTFLPTSSPQDRLASNAANIYTSTPVAQSSQFQGYVTPLRNCEGRTSDLMERWTRIHGHGTNGTQLLPVLQYHYAMQNQSQTPAQQRPIPSYFAHPQTLPVNYEGNFNQRPMPSFTAHLQSLHNYGGNAHRRQRPPSIRPLQTFPISYGGNSHQRYWTPDQRPIPSSMSHLQTLPVYHGGTANERPMPSSITHLQTSSVNYDRTLESQEFINWRPQSRMRGSLVPGTGYDHMIIRPTGTVQVQAQTLPPPQSTAYNGAAEIQGPSYPIGPFQVQAQMLPPPQSTAHNVADEIQGPSYPIGPVQVQAQPLPPPQSTAHNGADEIQDPSYPIGPVQVQAQTLPPPQSTAHDGTDEIQDPSYPIGPVQVQTQTLPPPQSTAHNGADEIQSPSYPIVTNGTQAGTSSLPVAESLGESELFWSMPPETW